MFLKLPLQENAINLNMALIHLQCEVDTNFQRARNCKQLLLILAVEALNPTHVHHLYLQFHQKLLSSLYKNEIPD